jgi:ATP-dependent DNA helicase DinG
LLKQIWAQQPLVLLRETGEGKSRRELATDFSQRLGLESVTKVQFLSPRQGDPVQLYLPDRLPLPNTPGYQNAALRELRRLLIFRAPTPGLTVILIQDLLLKQQVGTILAAEFGSRVQVDRWSELPQGILVASWEFWLSSRHQSQPLSLLAITTLPFPSVEHPLVAARVAYHKYQQQDWFQSFLLPQAVRDLQRAIAPIRSSGRSNSGLLAILDTRLLHRSYGQQILSALSPITRLNYLDPLNS